MSKSAKNNKGGSSGEVKKALKIHKDDRVISSKYVGTSVGAIRVRRTSDTRMKNSKKKESSDDEWDEDEELPHVMRVG